MKSYQSEEVLYMPSEKEIVCGMCGDKAPAQYMIRDECSPTGWICQDCEFALHPEWEEFGEW